MDNNPEKLKSSEAEALSMEQRSLTEVQHLLNNRREDGSYNSRVFDEILPNLETAVMEGGIPHAVSEVVQNYEKTKNGRGGVIKWMGQNIVQMAQNGKLFHHHPAAHERVDVETDEAKHAQENLVPGIAKVTISAKMSPKDAPIEVARREHLSDDDQIRVSWLRTDENGEVVDRVLKTLLVRDIPLEAWVKMLDDPNNIFGKSIQVEDRQSALSIMKAHREMELPLEELEDGPIGIVKAVIPYIDDPVETMSVLEQINKFEEADQKGIKKIAEEKAKEWLDFEMSLAESFVAGEAQPGVVSFIHRLQQEWTRDQLEIINSSWNPIKMAYEFSETLAITLENAFRNTLWSRAAVLAGSEDVVMQLSSSQVEQIISNEQAMMSVDYGSEKWKALQAENNRLVASQQLIVGRGCNGSNNAFSEGDSEQQIRKLMLGLEDEEEGEKWKPGVCRVKLCPSPLPTEVGACSVCRDCQSIYDSGQDPAIVYSLSQNESEDLDERPRPQVGLLGVLAG